MLPGFGNQGLAGEVQDAFNGIAGKHFLDVFEAADVPFDERDVADKIPVPCGKVVENQRLESLAPESLYRVPPYVTGPSCHEDHDFNFRRK